MPGAKGWGNQGSPTSPSFAATHGTAALSLPAGKAGLRPQATVTRVFAIARRSDDAGAETRE